MAARVRRPFTWHGYDFPEGLRVLFDLYATNHDPRIWGDPEEFRPERFLDRAPDPYGLVPQGGGEWRTGHRCAGEAITVSVLEQAAKILAARAEWEVPPQDLSIDLSRMPAQPRSGFCVRRVRAAA